MSLWMNRGKRSLKKILFNATAPAIAIRTASEVFFYFSGAVPGQIHSAHVGQLIFPIFAFALLYFLINTALVAIALGLERQESPLVIWWAHFPSVSITYVVGGSIALLIVAYTRRLDAAVLGIIVPLLVISYLTFKTSMERLADAERHIAQVNALYLSTIEALAMAIDAKDQVTHGHIRRVQTYAVELAKRLGVTDRLQLRAIEAAALLHDMGKLAIPEHILNKPGKLTEAEFTKMKRHVDIGADLLSSIKFPYPVVPIVRHHHENWDGSGYPNGLSGPDIPLGARILSVVDCFDALTSDRPYRPRLDTAAAFEILRQRRDTMYDPLIVDTFLNLYPELVGKLRESLTAPLDAGGLEASSDALVPLNDIRENAAQAAQLADLGQQLQSSHGPWDAVSIAFDFVCRHTPSSTCALYLKSASDDSVVCVASSGDPNRLLNGITIKNGERVSGWSVANETTISNSQAALDLENLADLFSPPLRATLATPLRDGNRVAGAITIYATSVEPFTEDHCYLLERVSSLLTENLRVTSLDWNYRDAGDIEPVNTH
jgi:putative nucleotidyltransferase with HDIG domain